MALETFEQDWTKHPETIPKEGPDDLTGRLHL